MPVSGMPIAMAMIVSLSHATSAAHDSMIELSGQQAADMSRLCQRQAMSLSLSLAREIVMVAESPGGAKRGAESASSVMSQTGWACWRRRRRMRTVETLRGVRECLTLLHRDISWKGGSEEQLTECHLHWRFCFPLDFP